uniref:Hirudin-like factor 2 n=1 Tax=Hirudo medicinalis TaxID=6421 RepID=A0A0K2DRG9_HIRME|nr:hirudin-like factor 2 [Hirudo medicinalis]ALA22960.1 hirudin-like factor 2 [Hirudo medicinalis]ALA22961.1 hirudin-like factor 2 [Hirudo medicinalis]ALA22962.1 hirudin-like factor 2 delta variant [Hirudo medicinalis]
MFSLKLFVVFLAICFCVSQAIVFRPCSETKKTPCLCGNQRVICPHGFRCSYGSTCIGGKVNWQIKANDDDDDD